MKLISSFFTIAALSIAFNSAIAQSNGDWCGAHTDFETAIKNNPDFAAKQRDLETFTESYTQHYVADKSANAANKAASVVRIIPVVVHIIHAGGTENISKAQILSQIDVLNKDFRRLNSDTTATPSAFQSIAADTQIEFRLAQLDPNGNCTDGINRVYSTMTNQARDNVKALIYWPRNQYLNIWVVRTIKNTNGSPGNVIGFAQFPGGLDLTDGVVIAYDFMGTIGTAAANAGMGRTTTHEVGHWLNLRHIWGDDGGACTGSDNVADTPNQADKNFSTCPNFPVLDACTPSGNGVLYPDYMDYTSGSCQNTFTVGQAARMNAALSNATSGRNNLWTSGNLALTGVSTPVTLCAADFTTNVSSNTICENGTIIFTDASYNGPITTRNWTFTGGTILSPGTASDSIVSVNYSTAGTYDVSLSVGNGTSSLNTTQAGLIHVLGTTAAYNGTFYSEGFETTTLPGIDWEVASFDGGTTVWQKHNSVSFSGSSCAVLENFNGDSADVDELISPTINMQAIYAQTSPSNLVFSFECAFARRTTSDNDALKVFVSSDCGRTWTPRLTLAAASLSSITGVRTAAFIPTSTEWKKQTVSITNVANSTNARIKFQFISGGGNNVYIDDINIINTLLGVDEVSDSQSNFFVSPNPSKGVCNLTFSVGAKGFADVLLMDILGNEVVQLFKGELNASNKQIKINSDNSLSAGVYFVKANLNGNPIVKKIILE